MQERTRVINYSDLVVGGLYSHSERESEYDTVWEYCGRDGGYMDAGFIWKKITCGGVASDLCTVTDGSFGTWYQVMVLNNIWD